MAIPDLTELTARVAAGRALDDGALGAAVAALVSPAVADGTKADFLVALREKGETAAEIAGLARALLAHGIAPDLDPARLPGPLMDVCGTGGDRQDFFNVSTATMFVLAAGGVAVAKHGNRGITSRCGGADVLEELGVPIALPPAALRRCLETTGVGFLFAPHYHPAFKHLAPVRKALAARGIPTVFNILGPLLNPARPARQLAGIFAADLLPKFAGAMAALGRERAWAVHGAGADELTTLGVSRVIEVAAGTTRAFALEPLALGFPPATAADLRGGDRAENARLLVGVLEGAVTGPKRDIVALNAGAAFVVAGVVPDLAAGIERARRLLRDGAARARLQALREFRP